MPPWQCPSCGSILPAGSVYLNCPICFKSIPSSAVPQAQPLPPPSNFDLEDSPIPLPEASLPAQRVTVDPMLLPPRYSWQGVLNDVFIPKPAPMRAEMIVMVIAGFLILIQASLMGLWAFDPGDGRHDLVLTILDEDASPLEGVTVSYREGVATSDDNGTVLLEYLEGGKHRITIEAEGFRTVEMEIWVNPSGYYGLRLGGLVTMENGSASSIDRIEAIEDSQGFLLAAMVALILAAGLLFLATWWLNTRRQLGGILISLIVGSIASTLTLSTTTICFSLLVVIGCGTVLIQSIKAREQFTRRSELPRITGLNHSSDEE